MTNVRTASSQPDSEGGVILAVESGRTVVAYDPHDPDLGRNPYPVYDQLRQRCPVAWSGLWGGFWAVAGYHELVEAARDDDRFRSGDGVSIPSVGQARPLLPIECDPPLFYDYRKMLNPLFAPGPMRAHRPWIEDLADELIDRFIGRGSCEIVEELALPVPARAILRILGLDEHRWPELLACIHTTIHESQTDLDAAVEAGMHVYAALAEAIDERRERGTGGSEDVLARLVEARVGSEERLLEDEELLDIGFLLLLGGLDTTTNALASAFAHLGADDEARRRLVAEPELIPIAVEEFLRMWSPIQGLARTVAGDTELRDARLHDGDKMMLLWGSANRDERQFPDPDRCILDRQPNPHVAFGVGIHRCLGAHIARVVMSSVLERVLQRLPDFRLAPGAEIGWKEGSIAIYGPASVPLVFTPVPVAVSGV